MLQGPNEVTLFGWDAYYQVHGPESKCERSAYYDILHPMVSLDTTRDPVAHGYRRKLWEQAFSIKGIYFNYQNQDSPQLEEEHVPLIS